MQEKAAGFPILGTLIGDEHTTEAVLASGGDTYYSARSDYFFQVVFVATAMSIVSGAVAERMKLWAFLAFAVVMTGFIYPVQGFWKWGGGALNEAGFLDFAGSGVVHMCGATAALAGVTAARVLARASTVLSGQVNAIPGANLPLATLGMFILWFGWFGFNGGSELKRHNVDEANAVSQVFVNTNIAACGGLLGALITARAAVRQGRSHHGTQRRAGGSGFHHRRAAGWQYSAVGARGAWSAVCWWCSPSSRWIK